MRIYLSIFQGFYDKDKNQDSNYIKKENRNINIVITCVGVLDLLIYSISDSQVG